MRRQNQSVTHFEVCDETEFEHVMEEKNDFSNDVVLGAEPAIGKSTLKRINGILE